MVKIPKNLLKYLLKHLEEYENFNWITIEISSKIFRKVCRCVDEVSGKLF